MSVTSDRVRVFGKLNLIAAAVESSTILRAAQRIARGSLAIASLAAAIQWIDQTLEAVARRLQGRSPSDYRTADDKRFVKNVERSHMMTAIERWMMGPVAAWRGAYVRDLTRPIARLDLPTRVRLVGWALVTAVAVHTVLLALVDAPVQTLGWSVRGGLGAISVLLWFWPRQVAAAWTARFGR